MFQTTNQNSLQCFSVVKVTGWRYRGFPKEFTKTTMWVHLLAPLNGSSWCRTGAIKMMITYYNNSINHSSNPQKSGCNWYNLPITSYNYGYIKILCYIHLHLELQAHPRAGSRIVLAVHLSISLLYLAASGCLKALVDHHRHQNHSRGTVTTITHGSLNVPIEHHPTIRYMVYNGYYFGWCPIFPKWDSYQPL